MKAGKRIRHARSGGEIPDHFVRGFVSAGLLASAAHPGKPRPRRVARLALQGGVALAAGAATLAALRRNAPFAALASVAAGAASLMVIEQLLQEHLTEEK